MLLGERLAHEYATKALLLTTLVLSYSRGAVLAALAALAALWFGWLEGCPVTVGLSHGPQTVLCSLSSQTRQPEFRFSFPYVS